MQHFHEAARDDDALLVVALQHAQFARALYVSALAAPGQRTSELAQAAAVLDGLPPAMRRLVSNARLRESIGEEQKTRR